MMPYQITVKVGLGNGCVFSFIGNQLSQYAKQLISLYKHVQWDPHVRVKAL